MLRQLLDVHGNDVLQKYLPDLSEQEQHALKGYLARKSQPTIAKEMGVTQPSVNYLIRTTITRISYLARRSQVDRVKMETDLKTHGISDVPILMAFWDTGNQSQVAKQIGRSQGFVRHALLRSLKAMGENEKLLVYRDWFTDLMTRGSSSIKYRPR